LEGERLAVLVLDDAHAGIGDRLEPLLGAGPVPAFAQQLLEDRLADGVAEAAAHHGPGDRALPEGRPLRTLAVPARRRPPGGLGGVRKYGRAEIRPSAPPPLPNLRTPALPTTSTAR